MGYQDRDYYRNLERDIPYQKKDSILTRVMKALITLMFMAMALWIGRTIFVLVAANYMQKTVTTSVQNIVDHAQENTTKIQEQLRQKQAEFIRKAAETEQSRAPKIVGYQSIWIPGKSSAECKKDGIIDNAAIACMNGHYATAPVYDK